MRAIVARTTEQAPGWLEVVREPIFDQGREVSEGKLRNILHLDEREQRRHLGLAVWFSILMTPCVSPSRSPASKR